MATRRQRSAGPEGRVRGIRHGDAKEFAMARSAKRSDESKERPSARRSKAALPSTAKRSANPRRPARVDVGAPESKPRTPAQAEHSTHPAAEGAAIASRQRVSSAKRPSALDAAAHVLAGLSKAEAREGLTAPDLIERMAKAKLWTSPGGKTPAATLYAAMIREIAKKGDGSRFMRVSAGRFALSRRGADRSIAETSTTPARTKKVKP